MPWPKTEELLRSICDDSEWLIRMVENLLSVTRINSGQTKITKKEEAAEEIVAAALMAFRKRYPGHARACFRAGGTTDWCPWTPF